ncbi:MAG: anti-sigma factor [bacterium]|nr:anti-sigma factor [bacterium]
MDNLEPQPTSTQTDCSRLRDLLPAYSIGATDPDETAWVESVLPACPEVADELAEYASLSKALNFTIALSSPPAALHDKVLAAARAMDANAASGTSTGAPSAQPSTTVLPDRTHPVASPGIQVLPAPNKPAPNRWLWAAAAAAALLILTNAYWLVQSNALRQERDQAQTLAEALAGAQTVALESTSAPGTVFATVLVTDDSALVIDAALPALPAGRTYQVWALGGGSPVSVGLLNPGANVSTFQLPDSDGEVVAFAISEEPEGGSPQPTTVPIATGEV